MGSLSDCNTLEADSLTAAFRVLVVGGSYGGLSVALNLQDLCRGKEPRCGPTPDKRHDIDQPSIPIDITIVDERDGYCRTLHHPLGHPNPR